MTIDILSGLVIKKVYSASTIYTKKNAGSAKRNRSCWAIIIKYEGESIYTSNGNTYVSNINNMVILPKGCSYEWKCTKAGRYAVIEFESDTTHGDIIYFPAVNREKLLKHFKDLEYKRTAKKVMYEMESIRDTYSIILKLIKEVKQQYAPSEKMNKITPAIEYITKNFTTEIRNDDLARLTGLSTNYFRKLFYEVFGISPIAYVHQLRIKKAKEMLKSDYGSITDIAQSLGYLNIYDFSRDFKKHTGIPPSKY